MFRIRRFYSCGLVGILTFEAADGAYHIISIIFILEIVHILIITISIEDIIQPPSVGFEIVVSTEGGGFRLSVFGIYVQEAVVEAGCHAQADTYAHNIFFHILSVVF
ncbi:unknown [Bacteroides sp. CAG:598]|nr:unknown [Bacteroides sp. CAG:598]